MIPTAIGLSYGDLAWVLHKYGFTEISDERGRTFQHSSGARLPLPILSNSEPLRLYHLVATRAMLNDYGIVDKDTFDLLMLQRPQSSMVLA